MKTLVLLAFFAATAAPAFGVLVCDFDRDTCGFSQSKNDKFDWTRISGTTPTRGTGPTGDHTSGFGHYMYIEASYPRSPGDNAVLEKRVTVNSNNQCLRFFYQMQGSHIGFLKVYVGNTKVFEKTGNQGQPWKFVEAPVTRSRSQMIRFEGVRGQSYQGDIAIDDISIDECGQGPPTPAPTKPAPPVWTGSCGVRPYKRIVGGTATKHGEWPWQVQLVTNGNFPFCGGSLIHPQWILTATHCLTRSVSRFYIRLGAHRRVHDVGTEQDIRVSKMIKYPHYNNPVALAHDLALLKLEKPAKLNRHVNIICLPDNDPVPTDGKACWVTGWGTLSSGGATPDYLQHVSVPIASRARCNKAYPYKIHDSMICAGVDQGGIDTCQGDSGGPMVCENGSGTYYIHGVTSWGYKCASRGKYGVYAKVKYHLPWIKRQIANN